MKFDRSIIDTAIEIYAAFRSYIDYACSIAKKLNLQPPSAGAVSDGINASLSCIKHNIYNDKAKENASRKISFIPFAAPQLKNAPAFPFIALTLFEYKDRITQSDTKLGNSILSYLTKKISNFENIGIFTPNTVEITNIYKEYRIHSPYECPFITGSCNDHIVDNVDSHLSRLGARDRARCSPHGIALKRY